MYLANPLRVKEALLSLLTGDVYGKAVLTVAEGVQGHLLHDFAEEREAHLRRVEAAQVQHSGHGAAEGRDGSGGQVLT